MKNAITLIRDPLRVISEKKSEFIIWLLFTIVTGQFGIFANLIVRAYTNDTSISQSLLIDSMNGSFYTFSIALVASVLGPIFINFINSKKLPFRTLKTFTIIIAIFYLFVAAIIYAAVQANESSNTSAQTISVDFSQLILYVIAIAFAIYGYCILRLESSGLDFNVLDDPLFNEQDDEKVEETMEQGRDVSQDENGIAL